MTARDLIDRRYSCRSYEERPIAAEHKQTLEAFMATRTRGPLGSAVRFGLIAAEPDDASALRRLGTYGFIKGATGFIVGAVRPGPATSRTTATSSRRSSCRPPVWASGPAGSGGRSRAAPSPPASGG